MSSNDNQADEKNPIFMETELPPYSDISNAVVDDDEKQPFLNDEKETIFDDKPNHKVTRSSDKLKRVCQILSLFGVIYLVNFVYFNFNDFQRGLSHFKFGLGCNKVQYEPLKQHPIFRNLNDIVETYSFNDEEEGGLSKTKEIISVTNPFVPNPRYGKSLYSAKLLHHSFGNSWGRPAVVNFTAPPKVSFDAVVLTLHTEVDGVQYDRLANLFVDGVQVWRTSTIGPGSRKVFSNFKKDVTKYSKLFKKDNVQILFQLDNLLTDKLTGVFDVTLSIDLYKSHEFGLHHHRGPHHKEHHDREEKEEAKNKDKRQYDSDSDSDSDSDIDSDDDSNNEEHHGIKHHKDSNHAKEEKSQKYHKSKNRKYHKGLNSKDSKKKPEKPEHSPDKPSHGPPRKFHKEHEIFSTAKPADQIYPLTFSSKPNQAPVVYLGSGRLAVELPKVSKNTTRLQLSIFTSGNAADEFWYSNVIDKFRDVFADDGNQFIGRGPARAVNVYFNGKKIVTQTPEPVIFTGGISPALWSPVVSFNAFDVPSIDVDVSGLLPYLWEHQAADDKVLEIEISNGLGEIGKDDSLSVNENWVTTANLLTYENDQVVESSGEVINTESFGTGKVVAISPHFTRSFQQFVEVVLKTQIISDITLKLKNGKVLNTTLSTYWQAEIANAQNYGSSGDRQSIVHVGHSTQSFVIQDNDLPESDNSITEKHKNAVPLNAIVSANTSLSYPLVLNLNLLSKKLFDDDGFYIDYEVKLVNSKGVDVLFARDHGSISTSASQNGKSKFVISSKGNHGVGASTSKYNSKFRFGKHGREYHRIVEAVNGTIVSDKTDTHREDEKDNFASVVQVVENHSNYENVSEMVYRILRALHGTTEKTRSPCHGSKGMRGMKGHHEDARHSGSH